MQKDLITLHNILKEKYYRKYGKINDLDVNRTEDDLTDSNYNFMTNRIEQTEMKVIHKSGNEQYYLQLLNSYSAHTQMTK